MIFKVGSRVLLKITIMCKWFFASFGFQWL